MTHEMKHQPTANQQGRVRSFSLRAILLCLWRLFYIVVLPYLACMIILTVVSAWMPSLDSDAQRQWLRERAVEFLPPFFLLSYLYFWRRPRLANPRSEGDALSFRVFCRQTSKRQLGQLSLITFGLMGFTMLYMAGLGLLAEVWPWLKQGLSDYSKALEGVHHYPWYIKLLMVVLIGPMTEELLFRGLMDREFRRLVSPKVSFILCSFIFGLTHGQVVHISYALVLGLSLGYLRWKSGSLWTSIYIHSLFNFCGGVLLPDLGQSEFVFGILLILFSLTIPVAIVAFKRYGATGLSQKGD